MLSRIVVPLDGSKLGEQVLPLALQLAERHHAELELVHVFESLAPYEVQGAPPIDPQLDAEVRHRRQRYLEQVAKRLWSSSAVKIQTHVLNGSDIVATLTAHLVEQQADLAIVASHGRGGLSSLWVGGVSSGLVRSADTPVLLVPASDSAKSEETQRTFRKILLPLDGTMDEEAIDDAFALTAPTEAEFVLLSVREPVGYFEEDVLTPNGTPETDEPSSASLEPYAASEIEGAVDDYLEGVARGIRSRGFTATAQTISDRSPAKAILTVADAWDVDLIVLETHPSEGITRFLHHRVADKVIRGARVPVLAHRHVTAEEGQDTTRSHRTSQGAR